MVLVSAHLRKLLYLLLLVILLGASIAVLSWLFDFVRTDAKTCSLDKGVLSLTFVYGLVVVVMGGTCTRTSLHPSDVFWGVAMQRDCGSFGPYCPHAGIAVVC